MKMLRITLEGKTYDVGVEVLEDTTPVAPSPTRYSPGPAPAARPAPTAAVAPAVPPAVSYAEGCSIVHSPMAGLVFKCTVKVGDVVEVNQVVMVLDAMKMETPIYAPVAGTVRAVLVKEGDAVDEGGSLLQIEGGPK